MWGSDDSGSPGACSDPASSPVNGTAQRDHNILPAAGVVTNCCLPSNSESHTAHHVPSKFADEKSSLSKCAISEASDNSLSHGAASTSTVSDSGPAAASSVNCHSSTRTSTHLYSNHETDDDGYFASTSNWNTQSTPNGAAGHTCQSLCSDYFSSSDVCLQSSFPQTSVSDSVHSDSDVSHVYACRVNDGCCTDSEQVLDGAEAGISTTITPLTDMSASIPANTDLCDDGYMDEMDIAALSTMDRHGDTAAWFVETDTCLDDFIDADMPHSAAVAGSTSTSSLSSTHDDLNRISENGSCYTADRLADNVNNLFDSDVCVNSQQQLCENQRQSSSLEEHGSAVSSCSRLGPSELNNSHDQLAACTHVLQTQMSDTVATNTRHAINMQIGTSDPSDSSHNTTPAFSDNCYTSAGDSELATSLFLTAPANDQVFEDRVGATVSKPSDASEACDRLSGPKQNQSYWLPVGAESEVPKFVCWSCFEVMNSANSSLPTEDVVPGSARPRLADSRDMGIMSRSATADYSSHDPSDLLTDDDQNPFVSVMSARMFSSVTL